MWTLAEALCYVINLRGRRALSRSPLVERSHHSAKSIESYSALYPMPPERRAFYIDRAGTFLKRYVVAGAALRRDFPPGFFHEKTVLEIGSGRGPFVLVLARELGARFVYGVEIDSSLADFAATMLREHGAENAAIIPKDMSAVPEIASDSVDQIISYACFEHIQDLDAVIAEARRVLKSGGQLFANFSPIWRHYYGSHLANEIPFPWTHLIFSEPTVRKTLERLQGLPQPGTLYQGLNKLRLKDYRRIFSDASLEIAELGQQSGSRLLRAFRALPMISEFYAGGIRVILRKP